MSRAEGKERRKQQVLAAAEASIRKAGSVDFSMKELAADANVSFATPFNLFGKKEDILAALFNRRVTEQAAVATERAHSGSGLENLLQVAVDSCNGYLADAELFRPLARSFRTQITPKLEAISKQAQQIWKQALSDCQDDKTIRGDLDLDALARRLHISFRVAFFMWAADALDDTEFRQQAFYNTASCVMGCTTPKGKKRLATLIETNSI